jgi:catechol 2,3-dioxygenase-like lactoylglutathione lyase family enzyme
MTLRASPSRQRRCRPARTGFIDHIGLGVPDLLAAKEYYDDLMSVLGLREWFETRPGGPLNYGPDGAQGSELLLNRTPISRVPCLASLELRRLATISD